MTNERRKNNIVIKTLLQASFTLLVFLLVWGIAYIAFGNELLVPNLFTCIKEIGKLFSNGQFWNGYFGTLSRAFLAFILSFVLGAGFALVSYLVPVFRKILLPFLSFLRSLPTMAILLILLVLCGAGNAPVLVGFFTLFPLLYTELLTALLQIDEKLIEMSRVYKVPLKKQIARLYLPEIRPVVLRETGAGLAFSLKLIVSAEVLAGTYKSLGGMMQDAKLFMEIPALFALVFVTFLSGLVFELTGEIFASRTERWKK